ncbi:MAG: hypothetical protein U1E58_00080 [Tabrizicola sp.]
MNIVVDYAFEMIALFIAAAALISAERAIRISRHALRVTKDSNLTTLRLRVKESLADAERSLLTLKAECQKAREQWEQHVNKHYPPIRLGFYHQPEEIDSILKVERTGSTLLRELISEAPTDDSEDELTLEQFIGSAKSKCLQIEKLRLRLEAPKPLNN